MHKTLTYVNCALCTETACAHYINMLLEYQLSILIITIHVDFLFCLLRMHGRTE